MSAGFALVPYAVSVAGKVGPAQVPVWAVAAMFLGSLLAFRVYNLLRDRGTERRRRAEAEVEQGQDIILRLDRLERKLTEIAPRRSWTRRQ